MMMKLVLLVAACVLGIVSCETHNQQKEFADRLIGDIDDAEEEVKEILKQYHENTEEGKYLILVNANSINLNVDYLLGFMQYYVVKTEGQSMDLQNIVLKLNSITYELEKSFKNGVRAVKTQLTKSVEDIVVEAKNLRRIIRESGNQSYRSMVLLFLDDLVTAVQEVVARDTFQGKSKEVIQSHIRIAKKILTLTLASINSADENVREDIVQYSSKLSSAIAETKIALRDFTWSSKNGKSSEVKEIIYSLSKIVAENEEVLFRNEDSFQKIKDQFRVTIVDLAEQLNKIVDASYSDDGNMEDVNMMYGILPYIFTQSNQLHRDFERTINNYIRPQSNE